ncbi:PLD-like domain [Dehalogenimonas alkenigignens]|uniref:PLD-like domain n=1 Tax=Dehalogenimonas alkenigignens TaxID=1217799 RepID=A0A0W0GGW7_9CHLR|nr:phospholipase D-like domain-containing protein [Dehalogenimonas alkenigignens]KTB47808.1 PLD-like domain [Dehalogenimonas alkenigignens]
MISTENNYDQLELVITPPEPYGAQLAHQFRARTTIGVLTQLVAQAKMHILIASPFVQASDNQTGSPLADALRHALNRNVRLDVISTLPGINIFKTGWVSSVGNTRVNLYRPMPNVKDEKLLGSHAKVFVVDSTHAYIGSANLTSPGLTGNLEMGVLVHGKVAANVASFWEYLITNGFLLKV